MITFFVFGPVGKTTWSELYIPVHAYLESNFKFLRVHRRNFALPVSSAGFHRLD